MQLFSPALQRAAAPFAQIIAQAFVRAQNSQISLIAAGCAFYATLAVFPGLSVLLSLYGLAYKPDSVVNQLIILRDVLPPEAYQLIAARAQVLISHAPRHLQWSVWIGTAIALWSASTGTKALLAAVDHLSGDRRRSMLRFQAIGLAMTLGAVLASILALGIVLALPGALHLMGFSKRAAVLIHDASFAMLVAFVGGSIACVYRFGPTPHPGRPMTVWPGTLMATPLWVAASFGFSYYVTKLSNFDLTYGPLAALAGVMLWFWVSSYVVLLGAALNATLSEPSDENPRMPMASRGVLETTSSD